MGTLWGVLEEILTRQRGLLTWRQAMACGLTRSQIAARVRSRRWTRVLPRVYATFTGELPRAAQLWAVVLHAGRGAVLSHETAAELAGLVDRPAAAIHVTVPADRRVVRIPGAVVHLSRRAAVAAHPSRLPPQTRWRRRCWTSSTVPAVWTRHWDGWSAVAPPRRICGRRCDAGHVRGGAGSSPRPWPTSPPGPTRCWSFATCVTWNVRTGCQPGNGRRCVAGVAVGGMTMSTIGSTALGWSWTAASPIPTRTGFGTCAATTPPPPTATRCCGTAGPT